MKTSKGNLINLTALNKNIKKASLVIWGRDENGRDVISDGHWIVNAYIPTDSTAFTTLVSIIGTIPENGQQFSKNGHGDAGPSSFDFSRFWDVSRPYDVTDTRITADIKDGRALRVFYVEGSYIAINADFYSMVADDYAVITTEEARKTFPLLFSSDNERALILPVNYQEEGAFLYLKQYQAAAEKTS